MLLFDKISSVAQILRLLHIPLETGRKFINTHFKFYVQRDCTMKIQNKVFGKSQDYNTTISRQEL